MNTRQANPPAETSPDLEAARVRVLNRRAWIIFALSLPLSIGAGFLGGLPYALARGLHIWGYGLGLTAMLFLIPGIVVAIRKPSPLVRARIGFGVSVVLIGAIVYTALFGGP
jgi:hypothetical protein